MRNQLGVFGLVTTLLFYAYLGYAQSERISVLEQQVSALQEKVSRPEVDQAEDPASVEATPVEEPKAEPEAPATP